jgi:hypothetical protein
MSAISVAIAMTIRDGNPMSIVLEVFLAAALLSLTPVTPLLRSK